MWAIPHLVIRLSPTSAKKRRCIINFEDLHLSTMQDECKTENIDDVSVEKQQEMLLMSKLSASGKTPPKSQSSFLAKKLQQRKYFDSGDYAMNQDKEKKQPRPPALLAASGIPGSKKPELPPALKKQMEEQQTAAAPSKPLSPAKVEAPAGSPSSGDEQEEHLVIPRPDTVPQRKASILHPSAHSKLSPQPLIHHETHDELLSSPQN
uniref:cAMP-regulated phosphoprotein 19 n=1 Tax=Panagrolaimus sp. JU765 TaxID=591449 RepID=A0AC34PXV1_9BILA